MTPEEVAERLDNRAGYEIAAYRVVGLPVFGVYATALVLDRQPRSCIEEFALRAIDAGLESSEQIRGFLGLSAVIVENALSELIRQESIRSSAARLSVTDFGRTMLTEGEAARPCEQMIWFPYDGLLRRPKWYGNLPLLKPNDAKDHGLALLHPSPARGPERDDLSASEVSEVVRFVAGAKRGQRDVLRIVRVEKRYRLFLPAVALAYRALQGNEYHVGFAIDGRISNEHEIAFSSGGGLDRQPLFDGFARGNSVDDPLSGVPTHWATQIRGLAERSTANFRLLAAGSAAARAAKTRAAVARAGAISQVDREGAEAVGREAVVQLERAGEDLANMAARPLRVYEHPAMLDDAIRTAQSRVIIISPWIRAAVVDRAFLQRIREAMTRGVRIAIGFGLGDDAGESPADRDALAELERLSLDRPDRLTLRRLGYTHAKILIKDSSYFVISSFNWLSFRGDANRPFREEWGTVVRDSAVVVDFAREIEHRFESPGGASA